MSVAPASTGVEQIAHRSFATATALPVLAGGATAGTGPAVAVAQAATTTLPNPLGSSADGAGITPVPLPLRHEQQFARVATDSCQRPRARHSGKCVNVIGASTADLALLGQRTCGTATGFQWSRVRHPASTPSRHP